MDNYDDYGYGYGVHYGEEYTDGYSEGEHTTGHGSSSSTDSLGGRSVSVGSSSVSVGGGSVSVSGSAGVGGGSASAGAGAGAGTAHIDDKEAAYPDLDTFKVEPITDLTDSDLDLDYNDYKDYYTEVDDKLLPAETENYQVACRTCHNHQELQSRTA